MLHSVSRYYNRLSALICPSNLYGDATSDYLRCSTLSSDAISDYLLYSACRYVSPRLVCGLVGVPFRWLVGVLVCGLDDVPVCGLVGLLVGR
jgi:hypothetical protein